MPIYARWPWVFATPTFCGDRIYMRVAKLTKGGRQELLYCLGKK